MRICIIGTGYVGLPSGLGFAELGHKVFCVDKNLKKIESLQKGENTLYEPKLKELLDIHLKENIIFTSNLKEAVKQSEIIIIAVGTPSQKNKYKADLTCLKEVAKELKEILKKESKYYTIAIKSTVPVGTGDIIEKIIDYKNADIISMPEFLREGYAIADFFSPDRIVCGTESHKAKENILRLYENKKYNFNILFTTRRSAELIKYASNAFLATKIQFINEISDLCEATEANIDEVAKGMGLDKRIGNKFLKAGIGYGGSCFPKDTKAIYYLGKQNKVKLNIIKKTIEGNENRAIQKTKFIMQNIKPKATISVLGLAFKNNTDDCRESPAIKIIQELINNKFNIKVFDEKAINNAKEILKDKVIYCNSEYECVKNTDACLILTEWESFTKLDWQKIYCLMNEKRIFDYKNILFSEYIKDIGFQYYSIGNH